MSKRAGLYARVSTGAQLENTSPESQLTRCRQYCAERGYEIVTEQVEAISGSFVLARTRFNELLEMAGNGLIDVLVCDIPDRLGRGDAIAKLELLAQLSGAPVEYASPGRDVSTIEGLALKATDQLVSGIERLNIRRRGLQGKRDRAATGRVIATACRPYGYKFETKRDERGRKISCTLVVIASEARVVEGMFHWLVDECMTCYAITMRLNEKGIPAPKGGRWTRRTVGLILKSTVYIGEWRYGKSRFQLLDAPGKRKSCVVERNRSDAIIVPVSPIISQELFAAAQEQLAENRRKFHRPAKVTYLLGSGRLKCAVCNGTYNGATTRGRWHYYRCRRSLTDVAESERCKGHVNGDLMDDAVWACVREALMNPVRLFAGIAEMRQEAKRAQKMVEANLAVIVAQIEKTRDRVNRLVDLYTAGEIDKTTFTEKKATIQSEIKKLESEREDMLKRLGEVRILDSNEEAQLRQVAAEIAEKLDWGTPQQRTTLLEILRVLCFYDYKTNDLTVTGLIGKHVKKLSSGYRNVRRQILRERN